MDGLIAGLDEQFARLDGRSRALLSLIPAEQLYWPPRTANAAAYPVYSCGEHLLRSAAAVEQTFGGITTNLWDDPFEWTLPESLTTPELVLEYLAEVEATRRRGFDSLAGDDDLRKEIMVPSGESVKLFSLLLETLARAAHHQGRAFAVFNLFNDARLPHL
jgi:hypothetical protein